MPHLTLSEIWIYPVKSLGGIRLQHAEVEKKGLRHDRRWMLVDLEGKFLTQRVHPVMALFKQSIDDHHLTIHFKGDVLSLDLHPDYIPQPLSVTVWDDTVTAFEVSAHVSQWFSERMEMPCRLVYFPEDNARPVDPGYATPQDHVSLADAFPLLIIGQSSLDDLNQRLAEPLPMNRFRPNLVFTGGQPYEEDTWKHFTVGTTRFIGAKPCARCVLTTVNQDTAVKGAEPLRTLATYRKRDNKIYFGQNVLTVDHATVAVGDAIVLA
ncbi:MOSC domain-containing protein [Chryseolinea lacunae]|uniref:MOSC domain-containing protein n=1 Tax=Chryseolinea lacunae TaxID=2801331 RepID=A0ABS1KSV5_9BACT|nr:MOSC N-terminal beta barrel domain-containing protein [Chryseolinea lacunae]MBL0742403.1 MOSC domain-containing protein [Chryseolinea lacunae]